MKYKFALVFLFLLTALSFGPSKAGAISPQDIGLKEGDLISSFVYDKDPDIFIINQDGFKRLFLNPVIFHFYGHLKYIPLKVVKPEVKDQFITSSFYRNCEIEDPQVYAMEANGEDTGVLHHINVDGTTAASEDTNFFKEVFCINKNEFNWYQKKSDYSSLGEVHSYKRMPEATHERLSIDPSSATLNIGAGVRVKATFTPLRPACLDATPPCRMPEQAPYEVDASFTSSDLAIAAVDIAVPECAVPLAGVSSCSSTPIYSVRGVSHGTATITASYTNSEGTFTAHMNVEVKESPAPAKGSLSISPGSATLKVGETTHMQAYYQAPSPPCLHSNPPCALEMADPAPAKVDASFVSDNPSIVAVDEVNKDCAPPRMCPVSLHQYLVRGVSLGSAIITATYTSGSDIYTAQMKAAVVSQTSPNLPPVISGLKGPTTLKTGETGTWTVQASDPENGPLSYGIVWGDEASPVPSAGSPLPSNKDATQTATFTHVYGKTGTFTPTFTVTDDAGLSAKTSASVNVGDSTPSANRAPKITNVTPVPNNIQPGQEISFTWSATDADNDNLAWSVSWGDGTGVGAACAVKMPSQNSLSANTPKPLAEASGWDFKQTHAWAQAGAYPVKVTVTDCREGYDVNTFTVNVGTSVSPIPSVDVTLDTATPTSTSIAPGQTNVPFAKIKLSAGNGDVKNLNAIQIASDSPRAGDNIVNARIYDGATPVGSIVFTLTSNGSYYYGWANLTSPFAIPANTSKVLTITADIPASASGPVRLGIAGLTFNAPGAIATGLPVYGATMNVGSSSSPSITVLSPNGGEAWQVGSVQTISWKTTGISSKYAVGIGLWDSIKTKNISLICDSCPTGSDGGSYNWKITNTLSSGQYTIRAFITAFDAVSPTMDFSDAPFTIVS